MIGACFFCGTPLFHQNNIKAQQSAGYQRWATIENLKRAAATMNFLTEPGIGSYEELVERCDAVSAASIRTRESLRDTEQRIADLALLGKQIDTYRKLKPVYDRYKASKDKEKAASFPTDRKHRFPQLRPLTVYTHSHSAYYCC